MVFGNIYIHKIPKMYDKKLFHLILPCGVNLKRWGRSDNEVCKIYSANHDIPRLLFFYFIVKKQEVCGKFSVKNLIKTFH